MVNQYKVFAAVMNNFDQAINASNESLNSSGATMRQNGVYMESLEAKVQALKTEFEKLVLGDGGLQNFAKMLVDIGTAILKFANSDIGQLVIKTTLLITTINLLTKSFKAFLLTSNTNVIASAIVEITKGTVSLGTATKALTAHFIENAIAWASTPMGMATIAVAGIAAMMFASDKLNVSLEEQVERLEEAKSAYEGTQGEIESLETKLKDIKEKIDAINDNKIEITDDKELQNLKEEEAILENQLKILKEKAEIQKIEYTKQAEKTLSKTEQINLPSEEKENNIGVLSHGVMGGGTDGGGVAWRTPTESLKVYTEQIKVTQDAINGLLVKKQELIDKGIIEGSEIDAINQKIAEETAKRDSARESANNYATTIQEATLGADENSQAVQEANEALDEYGNVVGGVKDSLTEVTEIDQEFIDNIKEVNELTEEQGKQLDEAIAKWVEEGNAIDDFDFDGFIEGLKGATDNTKELEDATKALDNATKELDASMKNIENMASSYDTLTQAMNEYNASGEMSISTLANLTALGSDWISLLDIENGQMSINEQGLKNLANAYIDDAEAKAYEKAMAELEAEAQKQSNAVHRDGQSAGQASYNGSITAAEGARQAREEALKGAQAFAEFWKQATKGQYQGKVDTATINAVGKSLETTINALEKFRTSVGKNTTAAVKSTKATKGSTSASKGNTKATKDNTKAVDANTEALKKNVDALKAQKDELQKEIDEYKIVIDYLIESVEKEIEKIEEARDREIEAIEAQKEALEDLADKEDEILEKRIDALKEARDAEEDYWDSRIQALKDANSEMEEQLELEKLLQNLENAKKKKVKVYQAGVGFVYTTDQDEVSKAQKALDEYNSKKALQDQIKNLEQQKKDSLAIYDAQIKDLEDTRKRKKDQYEQMVKDLEVQMGNIKDTYGNQIQYYKDWIADFQRQTNAYEAEVKRQLTIQKTGIDTQSKNWTTQLGNLSAFVQSYNAKLAELGELEKQLVDAEKAYNAAKKAADDAMSVAQRETDTSSGGSGDSSSGGTTTTTTKTTTANYKVAPYSFKSTKSTEVANYISRQVASEQGKYQWENVKVDSTYYAVRKDKITPYQGVSKTYASNKANAIITSSQGKTQAIYWKYASGVSSVGSNQMALVGDDPNNRELVIGSKLNGTAMNLQKGSGVVNAESTKTLAGLMNCLGKFSSSNFGNGNGVLNSNTSNSNDMYIDKVVIEGSNITDVVSFKNSLMNLKSEATQRAYKK